MADQGISSETSSESPQGAPDGTPSAPGRSDRLLSPRVILVASAVALLVLGGVALATLSRDGSADKASPTTSTTGAGSRISGASGASGAQGASGSKGSGPSGKKKGGASGSGAGPSGIAATGSTETTVPSDEEADIAKIRVAITPGTCLWDLDTFDLTARGSVRNNNSVDAFAEIEVTWLDSEGTELDVSSTLEVLSPGETVNWDVAGASIDGPVGALSCSVALLP
ncbi:MAG: hypothetical protein F2723_04035 [Actinobacteria bacterium]|uniref:Unannotated protein n=1 Tax=freshwater metagenome TaxID=449393 RepID=A0A6J7DJG8_9ZZZZ|nr:hypothetical protein [Actinomycetota bacterium]MSY06497.1 hypothetical protein [Actinomycetota bacterium]